MITEEILNTIRVLDHTALQSFEEVSRTHTKLITHIRHAIAHGAKRQSILDLGVTLRIWETARKIPGHCPAPLECDNIESIYRDIQKAFTLYNEALTEREKNYTTLGEKVKETLANNAITLRTLASKLNNNTFDTALYHRLYRAKENVQEKPPPPKWTQKEKNIRNQYIATLYSKEKNYTKIAKMFNLSNVAVKEIVTKTHIP